MIQTQLGFREEKKRLTRTSIKARGPGKENIPPGEGLPPPRRRPRQAKAPPPAINDATAQTNENQPPPSPVAVAPKRPNVSPVNVENKESPNKKECILPLNSRAEPEKRTPVKSTPRRRTLFANKSPTRSRSPLRSCKTAAAANASPRRPIDLTPPPSNKSAAKEFACLGSLSASAAGNRAKRRTEFPGYLQYQKLKTALCKEERPSVRECISEDSTSTTDLPGRAEEALRIRTLLQKCIDSRSSASLYISGPPGTGKSASTTTVLRNFIEVKGGASLHVVNCVRCRTQQSILEVLGCGPDGPSAGGSRPNEVMVVVLDEVDQVEHQNFLYKMFEWVTPSPKRRPLLLIAIANALDLTDRILPRLSMSTVKPDLMHFKPYTAHQIKLIIEDRIKQTQVCTDENSQGSWSAVLDRGAVELCARKVAASTGDARKALDLCRRAVEVVQNEAMKQHLAVQAMATPPMSPCAEAGRVPGLPAAASAGVTSRVTVAVMNRVIAESNNNNNLVTPAKSGSTSAVQEKCPLHHRLVVATVAKLTHTHPAPHYMLSQVLSKYNALCQERSISPLDQSQFLMVLTLLEARGILEIGAGGVGAASREFRSKRLIVKGSFSEFAAQDEMQC